MARSASKAFGQCLFFSLASHANHIKMLAHPTTPNMYVLRTHDLQEAGISMVSHYPGIHKWSLNSTCDLSTSFYLVFSLKTSFKNSTLELSFPTHQDACTIMHRILRSRNLPIQATILRIHEVSLDFIRV